MRQDSTCGFENNRETAHHLAEERDSSRERYPEDMEMLTEDTYQTAKETTLIYENFTECV